MQIFYQRHKNEILKSALMAAVVLATYVFVKVVFRYIAPFVVGYLLSVIMEPFVNLISKKSKLGRGVAAFICILVIVALLGFVGTNIILKFTSEARSFVSNIPSYIQDAAQAMERLKVIFDDQLLFVPDSLQRIVASTGQELINIVTSSLSASVRKGSVNVVASIPVAIMSVMLSIISAFFFIKDKHIINTYISKRTPQQLKETAPIVKSGFINALSGYFKAQLILMSITATICIFGLLVLRYPYALFVGLAIAVIDALPIFGSGSILWPWAAYNLIMGDYLRATGIIMIYGVVLITRQSLEPRILGDQIGIHPIVTLMSIYVGLQVFGVAGLLIGPALAVMAKMISEMDFT